MSNDSRTRAWEHVLAAVEMTLRHTLDDLGRRQERLDEAALGEDSAAATRAAREHESIGARIRSLEQLQERAEQTLRTVDDDFAEAEAELRKYVSDAQELRANLADWAARAIG